MKVNEKKGRTTSSAHGTDSSIDKRHKCLRLGNPSVIKRKEKEPRPSMRVKAREVMMRLANADAMISKV